MLSRPRIGIAQKVKLDRLVHERGVVMGELYDAHPDPQATLKECLDWAGAELSDRWILASVMLHAYRQELVDDGLASWSHGNFILK